VVEVASLPLPVLTPLSVASWLTSRNRLLEGARPIDVPRAGGADRVLPLARQLAADASG
jgi:hypothetical protein